MVAKKVVFIAIMLMICAGSVYSEVAITQSVKLTTNGEYNSPQFSPDNNMIAMTNLEHSKGLYVMNANGTNLRSLTTEGAAGYKFVWSADSKKLAFRSSNIFDTNTGPDIRFAIKTVDVFSGKAVQLTKYEEDVYPPVWSENGAKLLYAARGKLYSSIINSKYASQVSAKDRVVFTDLNMVYLLEPDGTKVELAEGYNPVLSPDGMNVAYLRGNDIYVMILPTKKEVKLGEGSWPVWSPDGTRVLYANTWDDGHEVLGSEIYVQNSDGTARQQLTKTDDIIESEPSWSSDGKKIVYADMAAGSIWVSEVITKDDGVKK
ncbi:MAG: hypothetical protein WC955_06655 [Elusimicrobiota bacterium]